MAQRPGFGSGARAWDLGQHSYTGIECEYPDLHRVRISFPERYRNEPRKYSNKYHYSWKKTGRTSFGALSQYCERQYEEHAKVISRVAHVVSDKAGEC